MSAPDPDPSERPLLFPDPVIEFYMKRIDRAAIRERLKMTPAQRLEVLQQQVKARAETARVREEPTEKHPPNEPAPPLKFFGSYTPTPDPAERPTLYPDPVVAAYLRDVDRSILRENLKLTAAQRLQNFADLMRSVYELRGAAGNRDECWETHSPLNAGTTAQN